MPQTRFVLSKALALGHRVIVVLNKIDRPDQRIHEVIDEILELLMDLNATDEQLDSPMLFCSARNGTASYSPDVVGTDLKPLFDTILDYIPAPEADLDQPFQMLVSAIDYNEFVGRIAIGRVERGELKPKDVKGDTVIFAGSDGLRYEKRADGKGEAKCIEEEVPFDLPEGWSWARLGSICSLLRRGKSPVYTDDKVIPVFAQKCNQPWGITLEKVKFLDDSALGKYGEELKLRSGDVVVNSTGTGTLGRVGLFNESILGEYPFIVPDSHVAVVRTLGSVLGEYVFHLLRSEYGQRLIFSKQTGSTNQKELPAKEVAFFLIPVPPLAEQRRIVKRIEEVFNLLD